MLWRNFIFDLQFCERSSQVVGYQYPQLSLVLVSQAVVGHPNDFFQLSDERWEERVGFFDYASEPVGFFLFGSLRSGFAHNKRGGGFYATPL